MNIIITKVIVGIAFGVVRFGCGLLPFKIFRWLKIDIDDKEDTINIRKVQLISKGLGLFQAFSGGVIFATCFLHMMPEVYESTRELKKFGLIESGYPYSQLIVSFGFFLVYFIEELSQYCISLVSVDEVVQLNRHNRAFHTRRSTLRRRIYPKLNNAIHNGITIISKSSLVKEDPTETSIQDAETETNKSQSSHHNLDTNHETNSTQQREISSISRMKEQAFENELADISDLDDPMDVESTMEIQRMEQLDDLTNANSITKQQLVKCLLIVLALALHAFFEGLAIGLQSSIPNIWYLFTAISIHSAAVLFAIGLDLLLQKRSRRIIFIHNWTLAISSPLGVFLGLLITIHSDLHTKAESIAFVSLEGLSAGTILYITFFEVLNKEKERKVYRMRRACCMLFGFCFMAAIETHKLI